MLTVRSPPNRGKIIDATGRVSRQSFEHVLEVTIRIVTIEFGGLDQAHDDGCAPPRAQRPCEQPVRSA